MTNIGRAVYRTINPTIDNNTLVPIGFIEAEGHDWIVIRMKNGGPVVRVMVPEMKPHEVDWMCRFRDIYAGNEEAEQ